MIVSLCDYSGEWSWPYAEIGHDVLMVDSGHPPGTRQVGHHLWVAGADVTTFELPSTPYAVLAAPPCTCFCRPGSRWWKRQDASGETERDVEVMRACLRLCSEATGWWALENPPGRHTKLIPELGRPSWQYQPWEYGDPWTKQTYIWGTAVKPPPFFPVSPPAPRRTPNGKSQGRIPFLSSSHKREREKTPHGFARAFADANPIG